MKSQIRFVMHPKDEATFFDVCLDGADIFLIDGLRWKQSVPTCFRSLNDIIGNNCLIWSIQDSAALQARYVPECRDWYCEDEFLTVQFLRSQLIDQVLTEGRLAINTSGASDTQTKAISRRFRSYASYIKREYSNAIIQWFNPNLLQISSSLTTTGRATVNPSEPDLQMWVGPHARDWLSQSLEHRVKQFTSSLVEARLISNQLTSQI